MSKPFFLSHKLAILVLLVFFANNAFANPFTQHFNAETNTFFDSHRLSYHPNLDGTMTIQNQDSLDKTNLGIGLTAMVAVTPIIFTTKDFAWVWKYKDEQIKHLYPDGNVYFLREKSFVGTATNATASIVQTYSFNGTTKYSVSLKNNSLAALSGVKYWLLAETTQIRNLAIDPNINLGIIGNGIEINISDIKQSGFTITDYFTGITPSQSAPQITGIGFGFSTATGIQASMQTITIDPTISDTGFKTALKTSTVPGLANWTNQDAGRAIDGNFATSTITGQRMGIYDFDFGLPTNAVIYSIDYQLTFKVSCNTTPCTGTVLAKLAKSGQTTPAILDSQDRNITYLCSGLLCNATTVTVTYEPDNFGVTDWNAQKLDINHLTLTMMGYLSATANTLYIDAAKIGVRWFNGADNNVVTNDNTLATSGGRDRIFLAIQPDTFLPINIGTNGFMDTFDLNADTNSSASSIRVTADMSRNAMWGILENKLANNSDLNKPLWLNGANCHNGGCYSFNGSGLIDYGYSIGQDMNQSVTFSAWVYKDGNTAAMNIVGRNFSNSTNGIPYNLQYGGVAGSSMKAVFRLCTSATLSTNTCYNVVGDEILPNQIWTHIVGTYDGQNAKIYYNGRLNGTTAATGILTQSWEFGNSPVMAMGARYNADLATYDRYWTGRIDDVIVLNTVLSESDINSLRDGNLQIFATTGYKDYNLSISSTQNTIDVNTFAVATPNDSNISASIGDFNGSYQYSLPAVGLTDGNAERLQVHVPTKFQLRFNFTSDTNKSHSPILDTNYNIYSGTNSCNYIWNTDLNMPCNCSINEAIDLNKHTVVIRNTGAFTAIIFWERVFNFKTSPRIDGAPTCRVVAYKGFG